MGFERYADDTIVHCTTEAEAQEVREAIARRLGRSLKRISLWCRAHRHDPVDEQHEVLNQKLRGHYQYYGRPTNLRGLWEYFREVRKVWKKWLNRRTRGKTLNWSEYEQLLKRHPLLLPCITRSWAAPAGAVSYV